MLSHFLINNSKRCTSNFSFNQIIQHHSSFFQNKLKRKSFSILCSTNQNYSTNFSTDHIGSNRSLKIISKQITSKQITNYLLTKLPTHHFDHFNLTNLRFTMYSNQQFILEDKMISDTEQKSTTKTNQTHSNDDVICKFGVITDVQFADMDNKKAWYDSNKTRYYRGAIEHLKKSFSYWNEMIDKPKFVLQLGNHKNFN